MSENKFPGQALEEETARVGGKMAENLAVPLSKNIGQTLSDCWFLIFGGVSQLAEKRKMRYKHNLEQFYQQLDQKIARIPEDKKIDPDFQTAALALEAAKYCVDKEALRSMFAELLASSCNADKADDVHPSFAENIKQMSSFDASILAVFKNEPFHPIVRFRAITTHSQNGIIFRSYILLDAPNYPVSDEEKIIASMDMLKRLGFIETTYDKFFVDDSYEIVNASIMYNAILSNSNPDVLEIKVDRGIARLTVLGSCFVKTCLND